MSSSEGPMPNYSRRFLWLAIVIAILIGGYSAVWYYVADKIQSFATTGIASLNRDGTSADCANAEARGYPFRIGLFCDGVRFEDTRQGFSAFAAGFRSAAQVYNPFHIVAELDSPAAISAPQLGQIGLNWDNLRASVVVSTDFPERISTEVDKLEVAGNAGDAGTALLTAGHAEGHMRSNNADLDLAGNFTGLQIDPQLTKGVVVPPLAGEADATILDGVRMVRFGDGSLRGYSGTIRTLTLSTGEATGLSVTGPFSVNTEGLLDADFTVTVRNPKGLAVQLAEVFPDRASQIQMSFSGLAALGDNPSLPFKVKAGKATLGFIPLGDIPPL